VCVSKNKILSLFVDAFKLGELEECCGISKMGNSSQLKWLKNLARSVSWVCTN